MGDKPCDMGNVGIYSQEAALLAGLQAGDEAAFEQLVHHYSGRLLAVARRFLNNEEDARDAVQDTFLSVIRAIDDLEEGAHFSAWLYRIARNTALMQLRARRRNREVPVSPWRLHGLEDDPRVPSGSSWEEPASVVLQHQEVHSLVHECIQHLPAPYRTVLLLRDIEDLDTKETAHRLGVSPNAVKIRLHRAHQALRPLLHSRLAERAP